MEVAGLLLLLEAGQALECFEHLHYPYLAALRSSLRNPSKILLTKWRWNK